MTLGYIPSQKIVPPCIQIYQDPEEDMNIRITACRALHGKDVSLYENVFLEASGHENPYMGLVSMQQLWIIGSDQATVIAFRAIKDDHNLVRRGAYEYLSHLDNEQVNQVFTQSLFDEGWYVKEYIFSELKARRKAVSGPLENILANPEFAEANAVLNGIQ